MLDVSEGFGGNARNCGKRSEKPHLNLRRITRAGILAEFAALGLVWCVESADHPGGVPGRNPAQVIPQYANASKMRIDPPGLFCLYRSLNLIGPWGGGNERALARGVTNERVGADTG